MRPHHRRAYAAGSIEGLDRRRFAPFLGSGHRRSSTAIGATIGYMTRDGFTLQRSNRSDKESSKWLNRKQVTDYDDPTVQLNVDDVTHMRRRPADQIITIYFVSGGGNEVCATVKKPLGKYLGATVTGDAKSVIRNPTL
jgi:hypothetical protein